MRGFWFELASSISAEALPTPSLRLKLTLAENRAVDASPDAPESVRGRCFRRGARQLLNGDFRSRPVESVGW